MKNRKNAVKHEILDTPSEIAADNARALSNAEAEFVAKYGTAYHLLGQISATSYIKKVVTCSDLLLIRQMKESKLYKGLQIPVGGKEVTITNFAEFCELALGVSREKINLDLQNLAALGEEFYAASQKMGLTYRQLRALRAMPEGDREDVKALVDNHEAIQEALDRHADEKAKLEKELWEKNNILETREEMLADAEKRLRKAKESLANKKKLTPDEEMLEREAAARAALSELHTAGLELQTLWSIYHTKAKAVAETEGLGPDTIDALTSLTSALVVKMSNDLQFSGIRIDFRQIFYHDSVDSHYPESEGSPDSPAICGYLSI